jgi:Ribbon-helix-helix domain
MARSGKTLGSSGEEAFDFSLATKRQLRAKRKELALIDSENLRYELQRVRDKIDWDQLRQASTEGEVNAALSEIDQFSRERFPNAAAILATVRDPKYPKIRSISFLAESCALAIRNAPKSADLYSPRYSRDVCYKERKRRGPPPKQMTNLEYWRGQAELGQRVPVKYAQKINKEQTARKRGNSAISEERRLTYVNIPEKMDSVKKRRTTVWLSETTIARLKTLSEATGAPVAELFRRAVEAYLNHS